jgi:hypothetical protein
MSIDPEKKLNRYGKGKYLLRHAFEGDALIPESILWREKAAFSGAVGHSLKDDICEFAEETYTDEAFEAAIQKYDHARPFTKESLLYRDIFEKFYPDQSEMVVDFWMPNKSWEGLAGSVFASCLVSCCFMGGTHFGIVKSLVCGVTAALVGTFGDLVESKFKRWVGVKDSSTMKITNGMGGFLDMFDSLLFAPAVIYILMGLKF